MQADIGLRKATNGFFDHVVDIRIYMDEIFHEGKVIIATRKQLIRQLSTSANSMSYVPYPKTAAAYMIAKAEKAALQLL